MIVYYLRLALRSLRRTPVMTALMVSAIGLGIGASMTMLTVLHVMSRDPIPERSSMLFVPHLDPLPKNFPRDNEWGSPADNLTWPDAMALLRNGKAARQAILAGGEALLWPVEGEPLPVQLPGRFATADFFPMFGVPMEHGQGWSTADDTARARVMVLSNTTARKLFGSADPVGRMVQVTRKRVGFRVVGVAADWNPQPQFYADAGQKGGFGEEDAFFLPLSTAMELELGTSNHVAGWARAERKDMYTDPSTSWLQMWVQLDTPAQVADYRRFLYDYAAQQHSSGRFERGPDTARLYPLMDWLAHLRLVPDDLRLQTHLAVGFLVVSLLNIVALLLAKFLRRGSEVGIRRALGARRSDVFTQLGAEAVLIGVLGGVLGIGVAQLGLWSVRQRPDAYAKVAQMDTTMLVVTVLLALAATLLAGLLPAWRASRIAPALQIKAS
ncbi:ABC transporter permease [Stenotrophomonas sp. MMGLT7]|uniref:ABC transporter permease n=1 Tax=Stenotrophomonas sp. MMGLT7 TaxID=2901227 RepID=UPI001E3007F2|nr:ABC transporter permease [Stenotrophomonas sp. MMGLT7]MCD7099228.1 ABC transporter permease [Stenotrophomonas sp. MMGLT7]